MSAPTYDLGTLHGGLRLPGHKSASTSQPIIDVPVPSQLVLPITQHVGDPSQPVIGIGERVLRGQLIAESDGTLSAPVHAPSSGKVIAIEPWPVSRRYGENAPCIIIECDGKDEAALPANTPANFTTLAPSDLLTKILQGGIVGLGGAAFPTAQKLMQARTCKIDHLLLNGVECESYISCDDLLMRERAGEIISGAQILMHALQIDVCFIAVESDKPEAIRALGLVLGEINDERIVIKQVPTIYPSGGEDQLVQLVKSRSTQRRIALRRWLSGAKRWHRRSDSRLGRRQPASDFSRDDHHRRWSGQPRQRTRKNRHDHQRYYRIGGRLHR
jgi:electron transport complex protein RnfC